MIPGLSETLNLSDPQTILQIRRQKFAIALEYFRTSAKSGNGHAALKLGTLYLGTGSLGYGNMLKKNDRVALHYFKLAARSPLVGPLPFYYLGLMNEKGVGTENGVTDFKVAERYLKMGSAVGHVNSTTSLANLKDNGKCEYENNQNLNSEELEDEMRKKLIFEEF